MVSLDVGCKSPNTWQALREMQYDFVYPNSWQLVHCTGPFFLCGSSTNLFQWHYVKIIFEKCHLVQTHCFRAAFGQIRYIAASLAFLTVVLPFAMSFDTLLNKPNLLRTFWWMHVVLKLNISVLICRSVLSALGILDLLFAHYQLICVPVSPWLMYVGLRLLS